MGPRRRLNSLADLNGSPSGDPIPGMGTQSKCLLTHVILSQDEEQSPPGPGEMQWSIFALTRAQHGVYSERNVSLAQLSVLPWCRSKACCKLPV